jgi:RNA polymerase sigma factor (sigma-70 family)
MEDSDLSLLERWRQGDRASGEALFARHFSDLYRFFEHKVGPDADDLTQSTFLACVQARDQFRGASTFRTYIFAIARRELYAHLRKRAGNQRLDFDISSLAAIITSQPTRMARAEDAENLRRALRELPAEHELLLELHYWHELDAAALSEIFEAPAGTIRVRLLRARRELKNLLSQSSLPSDDKLAAALGDLDPSQNV